MPDGQEQSQSESEVRGLETEGPISPGQFRRGALAQLESLHRMAMHLCRDGNLAEDLVQETYVLALRSAGTFRAGAGSMRAWMMKILHNAYRTRHRREKRLEFDTERLEREEQPSDEGLLGENARLEDLDWERVGGGLKAAIEGLPESLRLPFLLFAVEDLKYREIAEVLGVPMGTVMSRLARARKALVEALRTGSDSYEMGGGGGKSWKNKSEPRASRVVEDGTTRGGVEAT